MRKFKGKKSPATWLYAGGGGCEAKKDDELAMSVSFRGLVNYLEAYREYLEEHGDE